MENPIIFEYKNKTFYEKKELVKQFLLRDDIDEDSMVVYFIKLFGEKANILAWESHPFKDNYYSRFEKEQQDYNDNSLVKNVNWEIKCCKHLDIIKLPDLILIKLGNTILRYNDFKNNLVYIKVKDEINYLQQVPTSSTIEIRITNECYYLHDISMKDLFHFLKNIKIE